MERRRNKPENHVELLSATRAERTLYECELTNILLSGFCSETTLHTCATGRISSVINLLRRML